MSRGRRPDPPELQVLKGNPRQRKLKRGTGRRAPGHQDATQSAVPPGAGAAAASDAAAPATPHAAGQAQEVLSPSIEYPAFLTHEREIEIFRMIIEEFMPRNLARETDFNAYARYATYMHMWIEAKQSRDQAGTNWYKTKSKHGEMLRRHPSFQDMLDLGHELRQMETPLGLNPFARQMILNKFMAPAPMPSGSLPFDQGSRDEPAEQAPGASEDSPLGSLQRAGAHATVQ